MNASRGEAAHHIHRADQILANRATDVTMQNVLCPGEEETAHKHDRDGGDGAPLAADSIAHVAHSDHSHDDADDLPTFIVEFFALLSSICTDNGIETHNDLDYTLETTKPGIPECNRESATRDNLESGSHVK